MKIRPPLEHEQLCLAGLDEHRLALRPGTSRDDARQPVRPGAKDGALLEAVAEERSTTFALISPAFSLIGRTVSKVLPPIIVNGVRCRVLRLEGGKRGPRFLLRRDDGNLFGVYGRNGQAVLSAAPLMMKLTVDNPFRGVDFFETEEGGLVIGS
jgi:hypothetical protein